MKNGDIQVFWAVVVRFLKVLGSIVLQLRAQLFLLSFRSEFGRKKCSNLIETMVNSKYFQTFGYFFQIFEYIKKRLILEFHETMRVSENVRELLQQRQKAELYNILGVSHVVA